MEELYKEKFEHPFEEYVKENLTKLNIYPFLDRKTQL